LLFGKRGELLTEAHNRIQNDPDLYLNHIWGEKEFGGTSVLYISDIDLKALGWPKKIPKPIPSLTEPLVHFTPVIGMSVAAGLVGLNWIVKRRDKLSEMNMTKNLTNKQSGNNGHDKQ